MNKKRTKSKPKTYEVVINCQNCRQRYDCEVPKGTHVWDFLEQHKGGKCDNCGCQIVQSRTFVWGDLLK